MTAKHYSNYNRSSIRYRFNHWINNLNRDDFNKAKVILLEGLTTVLLFGSLFFLPHFFH